jgi:tRNA-uridine 2-sulfurtransferase
MSQQRHTIRLIEKESGLSDLILRPLSAQHFDPTLPEREGIVDRDKLLNISGRGRKEQFALAESLCVRDYPCPAGGCLLTDKVIAGRLRDLFNHTSDYSHTDLLLLTLGRHYRLHPDLKVILGRNQAENERIVSLAQDEQCIFEPDNFRGPKTLAMGTLDAERETTIGEIMVAHSQDTEPLYRIKKTSLSDGKISVFEVQRYPRDTWDKKRLG